MNFKNYVLLPAFVFAAYMGKSQVAIDPAIKSKLDAFILHENQHEWDQAFDMLYPKLLLQVTKQDLKDVMASNDQDGMSLQMDNVKLISATTPLQEGDETFVRVNYSSDLTVGIRRGSMYDAQKPILGMFQAFKDTYGDANVNWDENSHQFAIKATKSMMFIKSGNSDWSLLEINMDQPDLMASLLPATVMNTIVRGQ